MPNIALVLKEEISRVARKEVKAETEQLRKALTVYRSQIAALKHQLTDLERQLKKRFKAHAAPNAEEDSQARGFRFSASGLAKQRQRLGLAAREVGALLGVSTLSVYKWEKGQTRPRARQMEVISQLRGMGKKEALARLGQVRG